MVKISFPARPERLDRHCTLHKGQGCTHLGNLYNKKKRLYIYVCAIGTSSLPSLTISLLSPTHLHGYEKTNISMSMLSMGKGLKLVSYNTTYQLNKLARFNKPLESIRICFCNSYLSIPISSAD